MPGIFKANGSVPEDLDARLDALNCTVSDRSQRFKFFLGSEAWAPGQLEMEVRDGMWAVASVSPAVILKGCLQLPCPLWLEVSLRLGGRQAEEASRAYASLLAANDDDDE